MFLRYILFFLYIKSFKNLFLIQLYYKNINKKLNLLKLKEKKRKRNLYLKERRKYLKKLKRYIIQKSKYSFEYFLQKIKINPGLLQTVRFNWLIVKYRVESIYRLIDDSIRPNLELKERIWKWIKKRNNLNKKARAYFSREKNFKFI